MTKNPYWIGCLLLCSLIATFTTAKADTIHEAAVDGDVERVEQLLIGGADVNAPDADDEGTPLQWAMFTNQTNVVRLLLEYGANPNIDGPLGTPLQVAISRGNSEMFQLLLDHGADPNRGVGSTPLYTATQKGSLEVVELLLARGADPTLATDDGTTPLHAAAKRRRTGDRPEAG